MSNIPSADHDPYLTEGFKMTQPYLPPEATGLPWYGEMYPFNVDSSVSFPFEDTNTNVPYEVGAVSAGFVAPNQPTNTISTEVLLKWTIDNIPGLDSGAASASSLQSQSSSEATVPKYRCETCKKTFDRISHLENCRNQHSGLKPHRCFGVCGLPGCSARYASIEQLNRHLTRLVLCSSCGKVRSKQNMARHRASCGGSQ